MPSSVIQWFPGHMAKTKRMIREHLSQVDIVIEILDARVPRSSKNPEIDSLCGSKPILTVFNKSSLSDPAVNDKWIAYYKKKGGNPLFIDCKTGKNLPLIEKEIKRILRDKIERNKEKGMAGKRLKAMIVGIPNVGKSTLINRIAGSAKTKVEDRPGVTTAKQWVSTSIGIDLLDTPGILWPKFEDRSVGQNLAAIGSIKDQILDTEEIAVTLCGQLAKLYPALLCARYKLQAEKLLSSDGIQIFEEIGRKRGFLVSGGEISRERTASVLLDEFRQAKIGLISLETPEQTEEADA